MSGVARRWVVVLVGVVGALAVCASASALWTGSGTGSAEAQAGALGAPAGVTVSPVDHQSLTIAWSAPAGGPAPTGYVVRRSSGEQVCAQASSPCTDSGLAASTTYSYTVEATLHAWVGPSAAGSGATGSTTAPTVTITYPTTSTDATAWGSGCSPVVGVCGTTSGGTPPVTQVDVSIQGPGGSWWDGTGFTSPAQAWHPATGTATWSYAMPAPASGSYTLWARATTSAGSTQVSRVFTIGVADPPPSLTSLVMRDNNGNGKVDRVVATFSESIQSSSATGPWTLTNVPSSGSLASVSTSGNVATLVLTENATAGVQTVVGDFKVALAAHPDGIRDAAGNQASFTTQAPADGVGPVVVALTNQPGAQSGNGLAEAGDTVDITFSEPVAAPTATSVTATLGWISNSRSGLTVPGVVLSTVLDGRMDLGAYYFDKPGNQSTPFSGSSLTRTNGNQTIRLTLGTPSGNNVLKAPSSGGFPIVTPAASVTDLFGNAAPPKEFTSPTAVRFF